jgi:hypothetical protein
MNETRLSDTVARLWRRWEQRRSAVASARNDRIAREPARRRSMPRLSRWIGSSTTSGAAHTRSSQRCSSRGQPRWRSRGSSRGTVWSAWAGTPALAQIRTVSEGADVVPADACVRRKQRGALAEAVALSAGKRGRLACRGGHRTAIRALRRGRALPMGGDGIGHGEQKHAEREEDRCRP